LSKRRFCRVFLEASILAILLLMISILSNVFVALFMSCVLAAVVRRDNWIPCKKG
jgi:predicted PurR-regulated permease PerM